MNDSENNREEDDFSINEMVNNVEGEESCEDNNMTEPQK